ncbi:isopentenyl-diphosphate delta-isomerase [Candidatus Woesebacteria bacterium RIFOXYA1_FULL_40_18]|uniref:Isopentenyl-diphosphate delta-isomerase n=1 Tax=Candidatus Woesebacteria bacterium RIFOXYA1_FULL_40_18 TaxID=1802532 RepID=A0A1F8CHF7_9BACT|nr:MAG: isopentenyl-diphosphate delta-isomerase [Candidatus Woesebacteria bacterium RIFOXYA1_FULL_40_18]
MTPEHKEKIKVVLVNKNDTVIGEKEKFEAHKNPVPLHRAISIVIFSKNKKQMLITKRAKTKPTWPSFWSNAVCSHPYPKESYRKAAARRLYEELGIKTPLKKVFQFIYSAVMDNKIWGEHEYDVIFVGNYDGPFQPDPGEIDGYEWLAIGELKKDIGKNPQKYTPWFKIILKKLKI